MAEVGYTPLHGPALPPDGEHPERRSYQQVLLVERLSAAIARLNPLGEARVAAFYLKNENLGRSAMKEMFRKFLIDFIWPIVKDLVKKLLREVIDWLIKEVRKLLNKRSEDQATRASAKANAEEGNARYAKTKEEAERHEAIAKVWREVAEILRRDKEDLEIELEHLRKTAKRKTDESAESMKFEDAVDTSSGGDIKAIDDDRPMLNLERPGSK